MADQFDPYREALVVETDTVWPEEMAQIPPARKQKVEQGLHANPAEAGDITYVRTHTGFCRSITVTQADLDRLS